jgi:hypothetical protein
MLGILLDNSDCSAAEQLEFASRKILLAQLNEINSICGSFCDLIEQGTTPKGFIAAELSTVGYVVEEQMFKRDRLPYLLDARQTCDSASQKARGIRTAGSSFHSGFRRAAQTPRRRLNLDRQCRRLGMTPAS